MTPTPGRWITSTAAIERARRVRWRAPGAARVIHPIRGTVVVPCASKLSALLCAAEVWGCRWTSIDDAQVWAAAPGDRVAKMPYII